MMGIRRLSIVTSNVYVRLLAQGIVELMSLRFSMVFLQIVSYITHLIIASTISIIEHGYSKSLMEPFLIFFYPKDYFVCCLSIQLVPVTNEHESLKI